MKLTKTSFLSLGGWAALHSRATSQRVLHFIKVVFLSMITLSGSIILVRSLSLILLSYIGTSTVVTFFCGELVLYLLIKVLRDDFYYWLPFGNFKILLSFIFRVVIKVITGEQGSSECRLGQTSLKRDKASCSSNAILSHFVRSSPSIPIRLLPSPPMRCTRALYCYQTLLCLCIAGIPMKWAEHIIPSVCCNQ